MLCVDSNMWLATYTRGSRHELTITLDDALPIVGLRVWNYNQSGGAGEELLRGVKTVKCHLDGHCLGYWVRVSHT